MGRSKKFLDWARMVHLNSKGELGVLGHIMRRGLTVEDFLPTQRIYVEAALRKFIVKITTEADRRKAVFERVGLTLNPSEELTRASPKTGMFRLSIQNF